MWHNLWYIKFIKQKLAYYYQLIKELHVESDKLMIIKNTVTVRILQIFWIMLMNYIVDICLMPTDLDNGWLYQMCSV